MGPKKFGVSLTYDVEEFPLISYGRDCDQPYSVGVYIPMIRIPGFKGGMSPIPNIRSLEVPGG